MSDERFKATKYDAGKPPMELIPWEAMEGVARVLDFGRIKYAAHNWRKGFEWSRLAGACLRHLFAWLSGQDFDPESGLSHIDHALCCLMFLSAHIKSKLGKDDRAGAVTAEEPKKKRFAVKDTATQHLWIFRYDSAEEAQMEFPTFTASGALEIVEVDE